MKKHPHAVDVRISVEMIDPRSIEGARAANDPVDFVALFEQEIGEITSILACDPGNERFFHLDLALVSSSNASEQIFSCSRPAPSGRKSNTATERRGYISFPAAK